MVSNPTGGAKGRYLYLQAPGSGRVIVATELVIQLNFPGLLAGHGVAASSTDLVSANCESPYVVVDGVRERGVSTGMACTAANQASNPWVAVDLGAVSAVTAITLFGHATPACDIRLLTAAANCDTTASAEHGDKVYKEINEGSVVGVSSVPCPSFGGGLCGRVVTPGLRGPYWLHQLMSLN